MAGQPGTALAEQNLPAFCKLLHPLHACITTDHTLSGVWNPDPPRRLDSEAECQGWDAQRVAASGLWSSWLDPLQSPSSTGLAVDLTVSDSLPASQIFSSQSVPDLSLGLDDNGCISHFFITAAKPPGQIGLEGLSLFGLMA